MGFLSSGLDFHLGFRIPSLNIVPKKYTFMNRLPAGMINYLINDNLSNMGQIILRFRTFIKPFDQTRSNFEVKVCCKIKGKIPARSPKSAQLCSILAGVLLC